MIYHIRGSAHRPSSLRRSGRDFANSRLADVDELSAALPTVVKDAFWGGGGFPR